MYNRLSNKIKLEIESNEDKLKIIEEQLNNSDNLEEENNTKCDSIVKKFLEMEEPSRDIMMRLINKIEVHNDKTIDIYFNFKKLNFFKDLYYHN